MAEYRPLSTLNFGTIGQWFARLDHYYQARFRSRFAPAARALSRWIPPGGVVLDIGANHGKFAKEFARLHGGSCTVHCFEPLEYNLTILRRIVGGLANVKIHDFALSDRTGAVDLFIPAKKSSRILHGSAHMGDTSINADFGTATAKDVFRQQIRTRPLDQAAPELGIDTAHLLKIDVEGAEHLVIAGAEQFLRRHRPAIFVELAGFSEGYFGHPTAATVATLHGLGYRLHALDERTGSLTPLDAWRAEVRDYLCLPAA